MGKSIQLKHSVVVLLLLLLGACKSMQLPKEPAMVKLPEVFEASKDTATIARLKWTDFFTDEYLKALIKEGLSNNLNLKNALQNIEVAKAYQRLYKGYLFPRLEAATSAGVTKYGDYTQEWAGNKVTDILNGQIIPQNLPNYNIGFLANWEVDIRGKLKNKSKAAQARYLSTIEGKNWVQTNLIAAIANYYYELVALDNRIYRLNENIKLQEKSLDIMKLLKEGGRSNELAVKQFQAQILKSKTEVRQTMQIIVELENTINVLLARFPQHVERDKNALYGISKTPYASGIPSQLLQNRPDIRSEEQKLIAARLDTKAAKRAFYPSININTSLGLTAFSPSVLFGLPSLAYNVLGGLAMPILNRSALKSEFRASSALQLTAINSYLQSIIVAFTEVYNQLKNYEAVKESFDLKQSEVLVLGEAIENAQLLFKTNKATYLEVLVAQQNLLQANLDLQNLAKLQKQNSVNLYKALGGGV